MDKNKILTIGGVVGIIGGSVALYLGGVSEGVVTSLVGAIFVVAGIIAGMFKGLKEVVSK